MTEYRDAYDAILGADGDLAFVSADDTLASARLKAALQLPGTLLSDEDRRVIRAWDIYNAKEHGGVALPSVFVLDTDRRVLAYAVYSMSNRVPVGDVIKFLRRRDWPLSIRKLRLSLLSLWRHFRAKRSMEHMK